MINPHGVQQQHNLWIEELDQRHTQQTGRYNEVGVARRHQEAAAADRARMLAQAEVPSRRSRVAVTLAALAKWLAPASPVVRPLDPAT
jgi:hypothetical protein